MVAHPPRARLVRAHIRLGALPGARRTAVLVAQRLRVGKHAFQGDALKAFGFVFMLEGILSLVRAEWLSLSALVILMAVNAISTKGLARAR